jgi:hypothetical protein
MYKLRKLAAFTMLLCAIMVAGLASGCNKTTLAPNGVYQGDTFLYQAENTINTAHENFLKLYQWEKQFRQVLPVEVSRGVDYCRLNERKWLDSANALHDAYKNTPTAENKDKFQLTLNILSTALQQAAGYMIAAKNVAPNDGLPNVKPLAAQLPPTP